MKLIINKNTNAAKFNQTVWNCLVQSDTISGVFLIAERILYGYKLKTPKMLPTLFTIGELDSCTIKVPHELVKFIENQKHIYENFLIEVIP